MKIQLTSTKIINWICVLMILVMVVLLFTPYWQYETKEKNEEGKRVDVVKTISINDYVWFPKDHKDLTKDFEALYKTEDGKDPEEGEGYWINDLVLAPALVLVVGVVVGIISLWYSSTPFSALLALVLGSLNAYGYMTRPEMQLGSACGLHTTISVITAAIGVVGVIWFIIKKILDKKKAK